MNITIVTDRYYPHIGGTERYIRGLSSQLTQDSHRVTVLTGPAPNAFDAEIAPEASIIRTEVLEGASSKPQQSLDRAVQIAQVLEETAPDVVYANNSSALGAITGAQIAGIPVVYGLHGWGLMCPSRIRLLKPTGEICEAETSMSACMKCYASGQTPVKVKIPGLAKQAARIHRYLSYQDVLNSADARIAVSSLAAGMFKERNRTFAIHPGINLDKYQHVDSTEFRTRYGIKGDYILVPGRMNPIKGQMDALMAAHESSLDLSVVFAGNVALDPSAKFDTGPYGRALWERAEKLGLSDRMVFTGMLSQPEMTEAYSGAVATVVPSVWAEPFGYVAAESMACGTPVIITKNSGAAELVDDDVGQKVPRQDHYAIARALERVVPNSEELGTNARRRVEDRLQWSDVAARTAEVFELARSGERTQLADVA